MQVYVDTVGDANRYEQKLSTLFPGLPLAPSLPNPPTALLAADSIEGCVGVGREAVAAPQASRARCGQRPTATFLS